MKIGPAGIALIQSYERCKLQAYLPTPDDKWTIGWGHTGPHISEGLVWTQEEADAVFLRDIEWVQDCLDAHIHVPIAQHETDALASLIFNIGCTAFKGSTLLRLLNQSDFDAAAEQFLRWDKQAGKPLAGLTRRREEERALFTEEA